MVTVERTYKLATILVLTSRHELIEWPQRLRLSRDCVDMNYTTSFHGDQILFAEAALVLER